MNKETGFKRLCATENLVVEHDYEIAYLTDTRSLRTIEIGDLYGDPSCAVISKDETWCIVGGSILMLWIEDQVFKVKDKNLVWVHDARQIDDFRVEILIDPCSENSAVWEFNVKTRESKKLRDFDKYKGKEYNEEIEW